MIFSFEATTLQSLVPLLLERTFQAFWEMHLLSNSALSPVYIASSTVRNEHRV